jgi:hypothetical protein
MYAFEPLQPVYCNRLPALQVLLMMMREPGDDSQDSDSDEVDDSGSDTDGSAELPGAAAGAPTHHSKRSRLT